MKKILVLFVCLFMLVPALPVAASEDATEKKVEQAAITEGDFIQEEEKQAPTQTFSAWDDISSYKLVQPNGKIGTHYDSYYGDAVNYYYKSLTESSTDKMTLRVDITGNYSKVWDQYIDIEFFTMQNGKLSYYGETNYNLGWPAILNGTQSLYAHNVPQWPDQEYLYLRVGSYDFPSSDFFANVTQFKVKNPFYNDWQNSWAKEYISKAMDKGWVNTTTQFRPEDNVTRAEFIKIVNNAFNFTAQAISEPFTDVKQGDWWYGEVLKAVKAGYISTTLSNFRPNDSITREEVAAIISSIMKIQDENHNKIVGYADYKDISAWARDSVEGVVEYAYMGQGSDKFRPKSNITRAETVVTIGRIR